MDELSDAMNFNDTAMHKSFEKRMQDEIPDQAITLFPNPNTGSFTIQTNNMEAIEQVQVFNPLGQEVYRVQHPNEQTITLPTGAKGSFFVRIITATESVIKKILVE